MDIDDTKDLVFINGGCPVTTELKEVVAQRLFILLRTFQSEWFMSVSYGIPWLQRILGQKITKSGVDNILQAKVLDEEGVSRISEWSSTLDGSREYSVRFKVIASDGTETDEITI